MNDNEIRMEILFDYYKAMKNQTGIPHQNDNPKLKEIDSKEYDFNYGYLVKHDLVKGEIHHSDGGTEHFTPNGGIEGLGMDIVETFIDNCVENTEKTTKNVISKSMSYLDKIAELVIIWSNNSDLFYQSLEFLASLLR